MDMIKELLSELFRLLEAAAQLMLPEDPMLQGMVLGLLIMPAYRLLRKLPLIRSVVGLGERAVCWVWDRSGGKLLSMGRAGAAKMRGFLDGLLKK